MSTEQLEELGPIDYVVFEWQGEQPDAGEIQPLLLDLVDRGVVRILDPGTSAAVIVWENRWAAPVAAALRRSGGQLVASGRLPVQAILAALDEVEATN